MLTKASVKKNIWSILEKFLPGMVFSYRRWLEEKALDTKTIVTPWGFKFSGNENMASGTFEPEETKMVRSLLSEVDVLVNIGANIGYYCLHGLSMGKEVIAFEPIQSNVEFLCKNVEVNNWAIEILPVALSKQKGILKIYGGGTGASLVKGWAGTSEKYFTYVPCSTVDTILQNRLKGKKALFIIDVEGAEQWVLEGSSMILQNDPKPIWLIEIVTTQHQPDGRMNPNFAGTFEIMFNAGYKAFNANSEKQELFKSDVDDIQARAKTSKVYNFLFK